SVFQDLSEFGFGETLFEQMFGDLGFDLSGRRRKAQPRRRDLQMALEISLEEAAQGCEKTLFIPRYAPCPTCRGSGAKPGTEKIDCPECRGKGQIAARQGHMQVIRTCTECGGEGKIIKTPCPECHGEGRKKATRQLSVKVPAGIDTGSQLHVRGK